MKGWAENPSPSFSMDGGWQRRSVHHHALVVLCTFFHLGANVKRSALGQSNDGFPSWQLPLFQRSTQDEREKGGGGGVGDGGVGVGGCLGTEAPCQMSGCQMDPLQLFIRAGGPGGTGAPGTC